KTHLIKHLLYAFYYSIQRGALREIFIQLIYMKYSKITSVTSPNVFSSTTNEPLEYFPLTRIDFAFNLNSDDAELSTISMSFLISAAFTRRWGFDLISFSSVLPTCARPPASNIHRSVRLTAPRGPT